MLAQPTPGPTALLMLAYLPRGETLAELASGFGIGPAAVWLYLTETVALLTARDSYVAPEVPRRRRGRGMPPWSSTAP
jgi:hypothetical protein